MTHPLDDMFKGVAKNLLGRSKLMTITHTDRTGFSAVIGGFSAISATTATVRGIVDGADLRTLGDFSKSGFKLGDRRVLIPYKGLTLEPEVGDQVTLDGVDWSIIQLQPMNGHQDTVAWDMFIRKGVK